MYTKKMPHLYKTAFKAVNLAFDEDAMVTEPDSKFASRVYNALANSGEFTDDELASLVDMLADSGLLKKEEATGMKDDISPPPDDMASDERYETSVRRSRRRLYDAGKIGLDALRAPINRQPSAASDRRASRSVTSPMRTDWPELTR